MATKSKSKSTKKNSTDDGMSQDYSSSSNKSTGLMNNSQEDQQSLKKLFVNELKDIYSAEQQLIEALPEMADAAFNEDLQDAFTRHLEETKKQARRLEKIFNRIGEDKDDEKKCEAMEGLIEEGQQIINEYEEGPVRDAALIIAAQKVEHYEIASYGSLRALAETLGNYQLADILSRSLEEEEITDEILNEIAEDVNQEANEDVYEELEDVEQPYA